MCVWGVNECRGTVTSSLKTHCEWFSFVTFVSVTPCSREPFAIKQWVRKLAKIFSALYGSWMFISVQNSPPLAPVRSLMNTVHAVTACLKSILILSSLLRLGLLRATWLRLPNKTSYALLPYTYYMSGRSLSHLIRSRFVIKPLLLWRHSEERG